MSTLLKTPSTREGYEDYTDFYLVLEVKGEKKLVRCRPVFYRDNATFQEAAIAVDKHDELYSFL